MKPIIPLLSALLLSFPALADDILYTYCQMPSGNGLLQESSLVLLSYNLSTAEEALYVREDLHFDWMAGREPERDAGFGVAGDDISALNLALTLRASVARHPFYWVQSEPVADSYALAENPETCELNLAAQAVRE